MIREVKRFCEEYGMLSPGISVMVCVSGGTDSMCLLDVLQRLSGEMGFSLCAAHYNHRLRGAETFANPQPSCVGIFPCGRMG